MLIWANIATVIFALILVAVSVVLGYKRGTAKSLIRLGVLVVSIVLGYFISKLFATNFYDKIIAKIQEIIQNKNLGLDTNSMQSLLMLLQVLLIPIIFVILTFVIDKILLFVFWLIFKFLPSEHSEASKSCGVVISLLTCIISFLVGFMPINGYIDLVNQGSTYIADTKLSQNINPIIKTSNVLGDSVFFKSTNKYSRYFFDKLTTIEYNGVNGNKYSTKASKEFLGICEIYPMLEEMLNKEDTDFLSSAISALDYKGENSIISIKIALTKLLRVAGEKWNNGEEMFSLNLKDKVDSINAEYFSLLKPILNKLETCTEEDLVKYLKSTNNILKALDQAEEYGLILQNYANKLPTETATTTDLDNIVNKTYSLYELIDNTNQSVFYGVLKTTINSLELAGQIDPSFSCFFGVAIENLMEIKDKPNYLQQLQDVNQTLTDLFIILNHSSTDTNLRFDRILNNAVKENEIVFSIINHSASFNEQHNNLILLKVKEQDKILADTYIDNAKNLYLDNTNIYNTLEKLKNLIIVGK